MIIEITGVPGSGKSELYNLLKKNQTLFKFPSDKNKNIFFEFKLLLFFIYNYSLMNNFKSIFKSIFKSKNSLFHRLNILRNTIKKFSLFHYYHRKDGVYIIDEGISHLPFSLFVDSYKKRILKSRVDLILNFLPMPNILFIISASETIATERLKIRGHKRMQLLDKEKTDIFISKSYEVKKLIKKYYNGKIQMHEIDNSGNKMKSLNQILSILKKIDV